MKKVLLTALAVSLAWPAVAQQSNCGPRADIMDVLTDKYGESRRSVALMDNGNMVEMFASEESGTWTILVTNPLGKACLVASGHSYEAIEEVVKGMAL